jgi:hypothetical protein
MENAKRVGQPETLKVETFRPAAGNGWYPGNRPDGSGRTLEVLKRRKLERGNPEDRCGDKSP